LPELPEPLPELDGAEYDGLLLEGAGVLTSREGAEGFADGAGFEEREGFVSLPWLLLPLGLLFAGAS